MVGYGSGMMESPSPAVNPESLDIVLGEALEHADAAVGTVVPILRHVLSSEDNSLFGDEIVARIRGMVRHLTVQLLDRLHAPDGDSFAADHPGEQVAQLSDILIGNGALVAHLHALALETQLAERLHARFGTDPVLTPLLQAGIASANPDHAALAMRLLAAQARHGQAQRRMKLPLLELPGDHLHQAVLAMRALEDHAESGAGERAMQTVRREYDEAGTRLGLASGLLMAMGAGATEALSLNHAGVTLFTCALAIGSGLDRDAAVLSTHESQAVRLALALRSAGLKAGKVREECLALHPDIEFPEHFDRIGPDRAAALLATGSRFDGD
jgi:hypothetical protein